MLEQTIWDRLRIAEADHCISTITTEKNTTPTRFIISIVFFTCESLRSRKSFSVSGGCIWPSRPVTILERMSWSSLSVLTTVPSWLLSAKDLTTPFKDRLDLRRGKDGRVKDLIRGSPMPLMNCNPDTWSWLYFELESETWSLKDMEVSGRMSVMTLWY